MIKFSGATKADGTALLGIGLTRAECERLIGGIPIGFTTDGMDGLQRLEVLLVGGESESEMALTMLAEGSITPEQIREDAHLGDPHIRRADTRPVD